MKGCVSPKTRRPVKTKLKDEIKTDVDRAVDLVGSSPKDKLSLRKLKKRLNLPYDVVEKWARILDEQGVLELVYPKNPFIGAYLRVKKVEYSEGKDKKKQVKKKVEGEEVGEEEEEKSEKGRENAQEKRGKESGKAPGGKPVAGSGKGESGKGKVKGGRTGKTGGRGKTNRIR